MAENWIIEQTVELTRPVQPYVGQPVELMLPGDHLAHTLRIKCKEKDMPVNLTGYTAAGYFKRTDGNTVLVVGSITGNTVDVTLSQECYAFAGNLRGVVRITNSTTNAKITLCDRLFHVGQAVDDGGTIDPGEVIPSLDDLLAEIDAMEQATAAAEAAADAVPDMVAPVFSTSMAYSAGSYIYYDGALYRFTADHAAGAWNSAQAVAVTVGGEVADLKSQIDDFYDTETTKTPVEISYQDGYAYWAYNSQSNTAVISSQGSTYKASNPIAVTPGETYELFARNFKSTYAHCYYLVDENYDVVGMSENSTSDEETTFTIAVPENTAYLLFTKKGTSTTPELKKVIVQSVLSIDGSDVYINDVDLPTVLNNMESEIQDADGWQRSVDIEPFIPIAYKSGYNYWFSNNGVATVNVQSSTWYASEPVEVSAGDTYRLDVYAISATYARTYFVTDSSMNILVTAEIPETQEQKVYEIEIPENGKYLCITRRGTSFTPVLEHLETVNVIDVPKVWLGKTWAAVGDSLTEQNSRTTKHYYDYIADETGIKVVIMGESGSGYAKYASQNIAFYQRILNVPTDADIITIFGSFNDMSADLPIGTITDSGTTTIAGCINTTLDNLFSVYPLAVVGLITPTPWDNQYPGKTNSEEYVTLIKGICAHRSIPCLDLFHESLLRPWDASFLPLAYSKDEGNGVHPDETGHKLFAPRIKSFLNSLLAWGD